MYHFGSLVLIYLSLGIDEETTFKLSRIHNNIDYNGFLEILHKLIYIRNDMVLIPHKQIIHMAIDKAEMISVLKSTPVRVAVLVENLPEELLKYKIDKDHFSIFDILGHFIHGEQTDWIPRMKLILEGNNEEFESFDRYAMYELSQGKTSSELVENFQKLRSENIDYLKSTDLTDEKLQMTGIHPSLGEVNLEQLLNTWVVHDLSHINQINRILSSLFTTVGPWKEYLRILQD